MPLRPCPNGRNALVMHLLEHNLNSFIFVWKQLEQGQACGRQHDEVEHVVRLWNYPICAASISVAMQPQSLASEGRGFHLSVYAQGAVRTIDVAVSSPAVVALVEVNLNPIFQRRLFSWMHKYMALCGD